MYWIVETKEGKPIPLVAPCSEAEAEELRGTMDEHWPQYGPHRVVHLVEAGTQDVCWHCHDALEPQGRPHCHSCPADGECDEEECDAPGCRGEVPTNVCTVEPELAEVVKALDLLVGPLRDGHTKQSQDLAAVVAAIKAMHGLKPHQLRACGIEVDDEH